MCSSIPSRDAHSRQASGVLFAAVAGGFGTETVARIRVDAGGRIYVAGSTNSLDFPSSPVPDGDLVPEVPRSPGVPANPVAVLRASNQAAGLVLHAGTSMPRWQGERLNVGYAIDVLHPLASG